MIDARGSNMAAGDDTKTARLLEGYRQLAEQLRHEETISWKRLETFLVISSALIAIIGLFWPSSSPEPQFLVQGEPGLGRAPLAFLVALVGFLLSLGWTVVLRRSEEFHDFRYLQLVQMEQAHLKPLDIFEKADDFSSGEAVPLAGDTRKLNWLSRRARIYQVMTAVPVLFAVVWLILLTYFAIVCVIALVAYMGLA
jgi:hypothetical protein